MRAIGKYIVIEDIKVEENKTKGGLLLTESYGKLSEQEKESLRGPGF